MISFWISVVPPKRDLAATVRRIYDRLAAHSG
jgi:hypothetical protein